MGSYCTEYGGVLQHPSNGRSFYFPSHLFPLFTTAAFPWVLTERPFVVLHRKQCCITVDLELPYISTFKIRICYGN